MIFYQGLKQGKEFVWYDNGMFHAELNFVDGKYHGEQIFYSRDGQTRHTEQWENGVKIENNNE